MTRPRKKTAQNRPPKGPKTERKPTKSTREKRGRPRQLAFQWPIAETIRQASELIGWPESVFKQLKRAGAPGFKFSRVYFSELLPWIGKRGLEDSEIDWSRELKKEQALRARVARKKDEDRVIDKPIVATRINRSCALVIASLERIFTREFPAAVKGRGEIEIQVKALEHIKRLGGELVRSFADLATKADHGDESAHS